MRNFYHKKIKRVLSLLLVVGMLLPNLSSLAYATTMGDPDAGTSCGLAAHSHVLEQCYTSEKSLNCGKAEGEVHTHVSDCYKQEQVQICTLEESAEHSHGESCFERKENCICGMEENVPHSHSDNCYSTTLTLSCEKTEHRHSDSCYASAPLMTAEAEADAGVIDISGYSQSLFIFNQMYCTNGDDSGYIMSKDNVFTVKGTPTAAGVNFYIGNAPYFEKTEITEMRPIASNIVVVLAGLTMPEGHKTVFSPVFPEEPHAYKSVLNVSVASSFSELIVEQDTEAEINLSADLSIASLLLESDSNVVINTNGYNLTLTNTSGNGTVTINGEGTVNGSNLSCDFLTVNAAKLNFSAVTVGKELTLSEATIDANGGMISAGKSITASGASVSNAALFGFTKEASGTVTMDFSNCHFNSVAVVGAAEDCAATVRFTNDCSVASETGISYVRDYLITYRSDDVILTPEEDWLQSYRVKTDSLVGEGTIISEKTDLPQYSIAGYSYIGWKQNPDDTEVITSLSEQRGDLNLYIQLEAGDVAVTLDLGFVPNEKNCDDSQTLLEKYKDFSEAGTSVCLFTEKLDNSIVLDAPKRFGYVFGGWRLSDTETIVQDGYTINLAELTDSSNYALKLEAVWSEDKFPLYWTFTGIPLQHIELSLDGGTTWTTAEKLVEQYPNLWTWEATGQTLRTLPAAEIYYGESLQTYFQRLNNEWTYPVLRDKRADGADAQLAQSFRTWALQALSVSENSTFDTQADTGLLQGKTEEVSWTDYQSSLKNAAITLTSSFGTAEYNLTVQTVSGWTYWVDGVKKVPSNNILLVPNGAKVTFSKDKNSTLSISNWAFIAKNGSLIEPVERKYITGGATLYYDFIMPAADVSASYEKTDGYVDLSKGSITFEKGYIYNGIQRDGFWYPEYLVAGKTNVYGLTLTGMTPLCYNESKGYFYVWNLADPFYVTTDGVATINQLTLCNTIKVVFEAVNLSTREAYLSHAAGRTIYGYSVELPRDSSASGKQSNVASNINAAGSLSELGNIVLANSGSAPQTFTLNFVGTNNHVASIFSDQYYYGTNNTVHITGTSAASSALKLGTVFTNASMKISNIRVEEDSNTNSAYLFHAVSASGSITFSAADITAKSKEVYVKDSSFKMEYSAKADIGTLVAGSSMSIGENCDLRVRGNVYVGYQGMDLRKNCTVVIDENYLIQYFHWSSDKNMGAADATLIVKGNRCELGNTHWTNGTLICNALVFGRVGGVEGGTVIANQIMNDPAMHWNIVYPNTEYEFIAKSDEELTANGDNYPFRTYSRPTSDHSVFAFGGGEIYLLGYYEAQDGIYNTDMVLADTPVQDLLVPMLDADGNYNGSPVSKTNALSAVQSSTLKNNECVVLGNSIYNTATRSRSIQLSNNVKFYAAGNVTFFNDTTVSDKAYVWCGGTFGTKNDLTVSGGTISAKEVGIAYNLTSTLEDGTTRWKKLEISGGSVIAERVGTLSTCVPDNSHPIKGTLVADTALLSDCTLVFDEYVNYLLGNAGFANPDANKEIRNVHITGTVSKGKAVYATATTSFAAPVYEGGQGRWAFNSLTGVNVDGIDTAAYMTYAGASLAETAHDSDRIVLYAVKDEYTVTVKMGSAYVDDLNGAGAVSIVTAKAGNTVSVTLDNEELAQNKTIVWYTDASGYVRNPGYQASGNTVTFTMPYNDVEIMVAPDGLDLDLSQYHVTISPDGFRTKIDDVADDREFHYTGSLNICQSSAAKTVYRIRVLTGVDNYDSERNFTLTDIDQAETAGDIGLKLEGNAKAHFMTAGFVGLCRVEVPELSDMTMEGRDSSVANNKLYIHIATTLEDENSIALGNKLGKIGNVTLKNVELQPTGSQFATFGYSNTKNTKSTISYIDCTLTVPKWYSGSYFARNVGKVVLDNCNFHITGASDWPSPMFTECDDVIVKDTVLRFVNKGATHGGDCNSWLYGVTKQITITDSTITQTLRNNIEKTTYKVLANATGLTPILVLNGNTVYTSEERVSLNKLILEDNSTLNIGASAEGYLFASEVEVNDNAVINAGTLLVSGYHTNNLETRAQVESNLASSSPSIKTGTATGLTLHGGTVNAVVVGGDNKSNIIVKDGVLNAEQIGTIGQIYGYAQYIPKVGEPWVYTYARIPTGATIDIQGGQVNVGQYLGGMNALVKISGDAQVNLQDGAVLGMTDAQAEILKNYYSANKDNIVNHQDKNIVVQISGAKVEGDGGSINTPYGNTVISGKETGVKVRTISALYGAVVIQESAGVYENKLSGQDMVGVYVSDMLTAQTIDIDNLSRVYAENALADANSSSDSGYLKVTGGAILYTNKYGSNGQGQVTITGVEGQDIILTQRQFAISYVLHDDVTDPAVNAEGNVFTFIFDNKNTNPVWLYEPQRDGYDFMGWYESEENAEQLLNRLSVVRTDIAQDVQLHAAWKPKEVEFQIQIEGSKVEDIEKEWKDLSDGVAALDSTTNILTFTNSVKIPYRAAMFGSGENMININNFSLPSYSITVLRVAEDGMDQQLDASTAIVSKEILKLYEKQKETDEKAVITLRADLMVKKNEKLTMDLNLDEKRRPVSAKFQDNTAEKKDNTISAYATVGGTIQGAEGLVIDGKLNQPSAPGYTFGGWFTDETCSGTAITTDYKVGGDNATYFYAKWTANEYPLLFDADGGIVTKTNTQPSAEEQAVSLLAYVTYDTVINSSEEGHGISYKDANGSILESRQTFPYAWKQGFIFVGWSADGKTVLNREELNKGNFPSLDLDNEEKVLTLTAIYRPVNITYHLEGGTFTAEWNDKEHKELYGEALAGYSKNPAVASADTHELFGAQIVDGNTYAVVSTTAAYYSAENTRGTYYDGDYRQHVVRKGYTFGGWQDNNKNFVGTVPEYSDIELWAVWTANQYTLTLYAGKEGYSDLNEDMLHPVGSQATVVVGEKIAENITDVDVSQWPNRDEWYAVSHTDATDDKRFLLGFTFDALDPGAPDGEGTDAQIQYNIYASAVTTLINNDALFTKEERGTDGSTGGSVFHLPERSEYSEDKIAGTHEVPDYPNGSNIDMYAVYRERSLVFMERYVDTATGKTMETVMYSAPYNTYSAYPDTYDITEEKAAVLAKGYSLTRWSVNDPQTGDSYPTAPSDRETIYKEKINGWKDAATKKGSYDINVYTVYAAQVTVDKNSSDAIVLTAATSPTAANGTVRNWVLPGSMTLGKMQYRLSDISEGLNLVSKEELEANRYHAAKSKDVAIQMDLIDSYGRQQKTLWLDEAGGESTLEIGAGWIIRLTLYHSRVIAKAEELAFTMEMTFPDVANQKIIFAPVTVNLQPTQWTVKYSAILPRDPYKVVLQKNGFSDSGEIRTASIDNWVYGTALKDKTLELEGYKGSGQWKYSDTFSYAYGANGTMPLSDDNKGVIQLSTEYTVLSYPLSAEAAVSDRWTISTVGDRNYHEVVTVKAKGEQEAAYIWLKYNDSSYRLDRLTEADYAKEFHASVEQDVYTFLMPAGAVELVYNDVMELYLDNGTIDLTENTYTQNGKTVFWPGDYNILQCADDNTDNHSTANVLNLSGNLVLRGGETTVRSIKLGNLNICSDQSIALANDTSANLTAEGRLTANNILVPESSVLNLSGKDQAVTLSPAADRAAIGGHNAAGGTIVVKDLALTLNMPAGSGASGIGSGSENSGSKAVSVESCTLLVNEASDQVNGPYHGTWIGGKQADDVKVSESEIQIGLAGNGTIIDGTMTSIIDCEIGAEAARISNHEIRGGNITVKSSEINMNTAGTVLLCPENVLSVDPDLEEDAQGTIIDVVGATETLYHGSLQICDPRADVMIVNIQLLDLNNGDITVEQDQVTQNTCVHAHSGSYRLISEFHEYQGTADLTVDSLTNGMTITVEADCQLAEINANGDGRLLPLGLLQAASVQIGEDAELTVTAAENAGLKPASFGGEGSYVQNGGLLTAQTDLVVGGNMTLNKVTVSAENQEVGSNGSSTVTTVTIKGGSVTAAKIGAIGEQNESFTFVVLEDSPKLTGQLIRDHYRLNYILENPSFKVEDATKIPYSTEDENELLPTVLRSTCVYTTGEAGEVLYHPEIPEDPYYLTGEQENSCFSNWYLLKKSDGSELRIALSEEEVPGFTVKDALSEKYLEEASWTDPEDGTKTLDLYGWMKINGSGVIGYGRELNEMNSDSTEVQIETNGSWTARFDVEGTILKDAAYQFRFEQPLPAGTKLTLDFRDQDQQPLYYFYIASGGETRISEEQFTRMGKAAAADLFDNNKESELFEHNLQLSADFSEATAPGGTVTLVADLVSVQQDIAEVSYEANIQAAAANVRATDTTVSVQVAPGEDSRLNGKELYLIAVLQNESDTLSVPYHTVLQLGDRTGNWIGGNMAYFDLGNYNALDQEWNWSIRGLEIGDTCKIQWVLTAADSGTQNVFGSILAQSGQLPVSISAEVEPFLDVVLDSIDDAEANRHVLSAGSAHSVLFHYTTTASSVTVTVEQQGELQIYRPISATVDGNAAGTTVQIPGSAGVYRVRFSMSDGDWDDVYFSFIVK